MGLLTTLKFIVSHPLNKNKKGKALTRFLKWQLNTKLNPYPVVYPFTERTRLIIKKGMTGATGNIYTGLHEFDDMFFLLHFLRPEDFFIDIGANVGTYTVLSGGHVKAKVISVEPVPSTYNHLLNNILINNMSDRVTALNVALGATTGSIDFTSSLDTVNHVATKDDKDIIKVKVEMLDNLITDQSPALLKIDVEGFETDVINGATRTLKNPSLKAIIIELNGSGERYGYDEVKIHDTLIANGFEPYLYDPMKRSLTKAEKIGTHNTIYIRDLMFIKDRIETAEKVRILGQSI